MQKKRRRLLGDALKYYEQFLKERGRTTELLRDHADTWSSVGQIHSGSGERDKAVAAYRRALDLYRELHQRDPKDPTIRLKLARTLNNIAVDVEDLEQSRSAYEESLALVNRFLEGTPGDLNLLASKASTLGNLASNHRSRGKIAEAKAAYESARDIQEDLVQQYPKHSNLRSDLAITLRNLAVLLSHQGQHGEETLALYRRACDLQQELARGQPNNYRRQSDLAIAYQSLSIALRDSGDRQAAMDPLQRALEIRERLVKSNPGIPRHLSELAHTYTSLGVLYSRNGDRIRSLKQHERCRDLLNRLILVDPRRGIGSNWPWPGTTSAPVTEHRTTERRNGRHSSSRGNCWRNWSRRTRTSWITAATWGGP